MSDKIQITQVVCDARIGVSERERGRVQQLELDLELCFPAARRVRIDEAADYRAIVALAREVAQTEDRRLLEHLAEDIALSLRETFSALSVTVRIRKPRIADRFQVGTIGVEVTR